MIGRHKSTEQQKKQKKITTSNIDKDNKLSKDNNKLIKLLKSFYS